MRKVGEHFFHDNLEYVVDEVNENGTFNSHLVKVHSSIPTTLSESPVEAVEDAEPINTTTTPKRTYTRRNTSTKK